MRHQNRIFAYILTLVPHGADAEDIMQETASVAWEKFGTFKEGTDFAGVNMQAVAKMYIGVGDRTNPQLGSAGDLYIDDIWLILPMPEN